MNQHDYSSLRLQLQLVAATHREYRQQRPPAPSSRPGGKYSDLDAIVQFAIEIVDEGERLTIKELACRTRRRDLDNLRQVVADLKAAGRFPWALEKEGST